MRPQDKHDPGGRVRIALPADVVGAADFSDCGRYRYMMSRDWTPAGSTPRAILWCGMNPSTADAVQSDPTCGRELGFCRAWGFTRYLKGNMLAWRATNPRNLPDDPEVAQGPDNIAFLCSAAREAEVIVAAHGRLPPRYHPVIEATLAMLRATGVPVMCLGRNKDGSAKHPLYLPKTSQLQPF